jgi:hypothetical protein
MTADSGDFGGAVFSGGSSNDGTGGRPYPIAGGRPNSGGQSWGGTGGWGGHAATGGIAFGGADAAVLGAGGAPFDAGSELERNRVPAGRVCDRLTTIQCAGEEHCCPRARSFDACKQAMANLCTRSIYLDAISADPAIGYDIDRAQAAFTEFEKRASVCDLTIVGWALSTYGFRGVGRGTIPPGGACMGVDGGGPYDAIARVVACEKPEMYACLGAPGTPWTCSPRGITGSSCVTDMNCVDGFFCDYTVTPRAQCAQKKPNGATCLSLLDCESWSCQSGVCTPPTAETTYCLPY